MKHIFKHAFLKKHPTEKQISDQELTQTLSHYKKSDLLKRKNELVDKCSQCIDKLKTVRSIELCENIFKKQFQGQNIDITQLIEIWRIQKTLMTKKIILQNTKSDETFDKFQWSVRNNASAKTNLNVNYALLKIKNNKTQILIQQSKEQLMEFFNKLQSVQNAIDNILPI